MIALDISREWYNVEEPVIQKAGVAHKIDFREGPAMDNIKALQRDVRSLTVNVSRKPYMKTVYTGMKTVCTGT